tara:strand:+ start:500 stop:1246 length:747 start_codon:yes stop_codon:yes gene_type:complete
MESDWDAYLCEIEEKPASILLDLEFMRLAPIATLPYMAWVCVYMKQPTPDGLMSDEEYDVLQEIDERLDDRLQAEGTSDFIGRIIHDGCQRYYFYRSEGGDWEDRVRDAMRTFPDYESESGTDEDPEWELFFELLCPDDTELRGMYDYRVLQSLESNGDPLTASRELTHWAYFADETTRQAFQQKAEAAGFTLVSLHDPDEDVEQFSIVIARDDIPSYENIANVTLPLMQMAEACGGDYDSWESADLE